MPLLSAFTPCGFLELADEPSHAETLYGMMIGGLGGEYDVSEGSRMEAFCYASAMQLAEARYTLEHAGLQISPHYVDEMMADRELEYGITAGPSDTLWTRRAVLAARKVLPRGARREAVVDALQTLLGDGFVFYRTTKPAEILNWPSALGDQPQNLQLPGVPRKLISITPTISIGLGAPQEVTYTRLDTTQSELLVGDDLVVEPEILGRAEVVTVEAVVAPPLGPYAFTATFDQAHEPGCLATTQPFPAWVGSQRFALIIVTAAAATNPETRRKIDELMQRVARGVSTWAIVAQSGAGTAGPFTIGVSPLGSVPIGTITFP
jgi:hypothetical protein